MSSGLTTNCPNLHTGDMGGGRAEPQTFDRLAGPGLRRSPATAGFSPGANSTSAQISGGSISIRPHCDDLQQASNVIKVKWWAV